MFITTVPPAKKKSADIKEFYDRFFSLFYGFYIPTLKAQNRNLKNFSQSSAHRIHQRKRTQNPILQFYPSPAKTIAQKERFAVKVITCISEGFVNTTAKAIFVYPRREGRCSLSEIRERDLVLRRQEVYAHARQVLRRRAEIESNAQRVEVLRQIGEDEANAARAAEEAVAVRAEQECGEEAQGDAVASSSSSSSPTYLSIAAPAPEYCYPADGELLEGDWEMLEEIEERLEDGIEYSVAKEMVEDFLLSCGRRGIMGDGGMD